MKGLVPMLEYRSIVFISSAEKGTISSFRFFLLLAEQEEAERRAYSNPGNKHLARHEIAELYGLSNEAPTL